MATELIQARVEANLKDEVTRILEENGLDIPTAIRMYFAKIKRVGGIPFDVRVADTPNFPAATVLSPSDFDEFVSALDEPFPQAAQNLLNRPFE